MHFKLSYRQLKKDKNSCNINNRDIDRQTGVSRWVYLKLCPAAAVGSRPGCRRCGAARPSSLWCHTEHRCLFINLQTCWVTVSRTSRTVHLHPSTLLFLLLPVLLGASGWNQESFTTAQEAGSEPWSPLIGRDDLWNTDGGGQCSVWRLLCSIQQRLSHLRTRWTCAPLWQVEELSTQTHTHSRTRRCDCCFFCRYLCCIVFAGKVLVEKSKKIIILTINESFCSFFNQEDQTLSGSCW